MLPVDRDQKPRNFINNMRTAGSTVNKHVVYGVFVGLIKSDLPKYSRYLGVVFANGWLQSLEKRMNLTRKMVTRPAFEKSTWLEVNTKFLHDIVSVTIMHEIPGEILMNVDQTPSKYVLTVNVTMVKKNSEKR